MAAARLVTFLLGFGVAYTSPQVGSPQRFMAIGPRTPNHIAPQNCLQDCVQGVCRSGGSIRTSLHLADDSRTQTPQGVIVAPSLDEALRMYILLASGQALSPLFP